MRGFLQTTPRRTDGAALRPEPAPAGRLRPASTFAHLAARLHGGAPIQRRAADGPARDFSGVAGPGRSPSVGTLPAGLRADVEARSGLPMDDVRVHRDSGRPAQVGALAYARGRDIHLGPGQERHLPHEAWHVVQQKQGRVRSTGRAGGVPINLDGGLEREAESVGTRPADRGDAESRAASMAGLDLFRPPDAMRGTGAAFPSLRGSAGSLHPAGGFSDAGAVAQLYPGVDPTLHNQDITDPVIYQNGVYNVNPTARSIWNLTANDNGIMQYVVPKGSATMIVGTRNAGYPHPCLIGGANPEVSAAGEIAIHHGEPYAINTKSGHFKPPDGCLTIALGIINARYPNLGYDIQTGGHTFALGGLAPTTMPQLAPAARANRIATEQAASAASQASQTVTINVAPWKPPPSGPSKYFG